MQVLTQRLAKLRQTIRQLERQFNRIPGSVQLLAVSKQQPAALILQALQLGQYSFGENQLQSLQTRQTILAEHPLIWHFIGQLQANKTRGVAEICSWVHSVDRLKLARRLNDQRPPARMPLNICVQVNIDNAPQKGGISPAELMPLMAQLRQLPNLRLRGLMAIPEPRLEFAAQLEVFKRVKALFDQLNASGYRLDTLSMGMTNDLAAAIAAGATMVRIGTGLFGER